MLLGLLIILFREEKFSIDPERNSFFAIEIELFLQTVFRSIKSFYNWQFAKRFLRLWFQGFGQGYSLYYPLNQNGYISVCDKGFQFLLLSRAKTSQLEDFSTILSLKMIQLWVNKFNCRIKQYIIMNAANRPPKDTASNSVDR